MPKKYFLNQQPFVPNPFNRQKFTDPFFPPNESSLFGLDIHGNFIDKINGPKKKSHLLEAVSLKEISWKRASELRSSDKLYESHLGIEEMKQGVLGDCYFLTVVSSVSFFPNYIRRILGNLKRYNEYGYYELNLFVDNEWQTVILDDYFPYSSYRRNFIFAKSKNNLLWIMLIEKAWAKVNGGYSNIIGSSSGRLSNEFQFLTGFHEVNFYFYDGESMQHQIETNDSIFNRLSKAVKNKSLINAGSYDKGSKRLPDIGIANNHSYCLLDCEEMYKGMQMIKLHNPWGNNAFIGSNSFRQFPESQARTYIDYNKNVKDGTFWVDIDTFVKYFVFTKICKMFFDANVKSYSLEDEKCFQLPLVFNLVIDKNNNQNQPNDFSFGLIFPKIKYSNFSKKEIERPCYFVLVKCKEGSDEYVYVSSEYEILKDLNFQTPLTPGHYLIWIYLPFKHFKGVQELDYNCKFQIISSSKYVIKFVGYDSKYELINDIAEFSIRSNYSEEINNSFLQNKSLFSKVSSSLIKGMFVCYVKNTSENIFKSINFKNKKYGLDYLPPMNSDYQAIYSIQPSQGFTFVLVGTGNTEKSFSLGISCCRSNQRGSPYYKKYLTFCKFRNIGNIDEDIYFTIYKTPPEKKVNISIAQSIVDLNDNGEDLTMSQINHLIEDIESNDNNNNMINNNNIASNDELIKFLMDLGFSQEQCEEALRHSNNDQSLAVDYLYMNYNPQEERINNNDNINENNDNNLINNNSYQYNDVNQQDLEKLANLGFSKNKCYEVLKRNSNNLNKALEDLLKESQRNINTVNTDNLNNRDDIFNSTLLIRRSIMEEKKGSLFIYPFKTVEIQPESFKKIKWSCSYCTFLNENKQKECIICQKKREKEKYELVKGVNIKIRPFNIKWKCTECQYDNNTVSEYCTNCGEKKRYILLTYNYKH